MEKGRDGRSPCAARRPRGRAGLRREGYFTPIQPEMTIFWTSLVPS